MVYVQNFASLDEFKFVESTNSLSELIDNLSALSAGVNLHSVLVTFLWPKKLKIGIL